MQDKNALASGQLVGPSRRSRFRDRKQNDQQVGQHNTEDDQHNTRRISCTIPSRPTSCRTCIAPAQVEARVQTQQLFFAPNNTGRRSNIIADFLADRPTNPTRVDQSIQSVKVRSHLHSMRLTGGNKRSKVEAETCVSPRTTYQTKDQRIIIKEYQH